ncbi:MAG: hypothetical protein QM296_09900 [Bacillota bacterium]|nr:hypothetical protein [Bacillota bacterium]
MSNEKITKLLAERERLMRELCEDPFFLKGTWLEAYTTCIRPNCKCHQGEKHGPRYYLRTVEDGKVVRHYVRQKDAELVKSGIERNERAEKLMQEITRINLKLIREGFYEDQ